MSQQLNDIIYPNSWVLKTVFLLKSRLENLDFLELDFPDSQTEEGSFLVFYNNRKFCFEISNDQVITLTTNGYPDTDGNTYKISLDFKFEEVIKFILSGKDRD